MKERVRVVVRLRPGAEGDRAVKVTGPDRVQLTTHGIREYVFDHILDEEASQSATAVACSADALEAVLNGRNGLIMAYGPTGTGKTHSMDLAHICG